jgi:hypothetical protein
MPASSRMSEQPSLTDAIQLVVGRSLTKAVKEAAGRHAWLEDEASEVDDEAPRGTAGRRAPRRPLAVCARLAVVVILAFAFLHAASTPTVLDAQRGPPTAAHRRVALVIGNSAYRYTSRLENPRNDAADMSATLKRLGFEVIEGFDLDKAAFDAKVREFAAALAGAEVGLFFYSGHGMQVSGHNYLVPVDARLTTLAALDPEMVRLEHVHQTMERHARTNLLFFDACRNNPLARSLARTMGLRSPEIGYGLAAVESGAGTLISFSTQPGNVALDGPGRNSPYSGALVRQIAAQDADLNAILIAVRNEVMRQTDRKQVPWEHSALTRQFYFNTAAQMPGRPPGPRLRLNEAAEAWSAAKDTGSIAVLDAYVARYGDEFFAELARARIEELRQRAEPLSAP